MKATIWFDMDGTIADLYAVDGWLDSLRNFETRPYDEARPMLNFSAFAKLLHRVQSAGYAIGIITWGSKVATDEYNEAVAQAKQKWLRKHLPSVKWDAFNFLPYGVSKMSVRNSEVDILFDDEERNRKEWDGWSFEPCDIQEVLKNL